MATAMAEMYNLGDSDQNEKLEKAEFVRVRKSIRKIIGNFR